MSHKDFLLLSLLEVGRLERLRASRPLDQPHFLKKTTVLAAIAAAKRIAS